MFLKKCLTKRSGNIKIYMIEIQINMFQRSFINCMDGKTYDSRGVFETEGLINWKTTPQFNTKLIPVIHAQV